jgi:hypothetical protein
MVRIPGDRKSSKPDFIAAHQVCGSDGSPAARPTCRCVAQNIRDDIATTRDSFTKPVEVEDVIITRVCERNNPENKDNSKQPSTVLTYHFKNLHPTACRTGAVILGIHSCDTSDRLPLPCSQSSTPWPRMSITGYRHMYNFPYLCWMPIPAAHIALSLLIISMQPSCRC